LADRLLDVHALVRRLRGQRVYLDTNIFIYVLNQTPGLAGPSVALLQACADREILGQTGNLTLAELLVKPLQANDAAAVAVVKQLLVTDGVIELLEHDRSCFEEAALLRARHGLKMADALHLATATRAGAACLVSNDRRFPTAGPVECIGLVE
jgi:predicted nucleic acid-binding protein